MHNKIVNTLVVVVSLLFALGAAEIVLRTFYKERLAYYPWLQHDRTLTFRYDERLGWFPIENSKKTFSGSRPIQVRHNSRGFRDPEHVLDGRPRMLFVGDSFLWGYDVEEAQRLTERLRSRLPEWAIYNLGVSGYATDQEYLLLERHFDYYRPDVVVLIFCVDNDVPDNASSMIPGGYYKPYYETRDGKLELSGVPVPKSENYFFGTYPNITRSYAARALVKAWYGLSAPTPVTVINPTRRLLIMMRDFVISRGAKFAVGLQNSDAALEGFLRSQGVPVIDVSNPYRYAEQGGHWTPIGHYQVSERIYQLLRETDYLDRRRDARSQAR